MANPEQIVTKQKVSEKVPRRALSSKSILHLLDRKRLKDKPEWGGRAKNESDDGNDYWWHMNCGVYLKDGDGWVRIFGEAQEKNKSKAITAAADKVVKKLKKTPAALRDEMICGVLRVPFDSASPSAAHDETDNDGSSDTSGEEVVHAPNGNGVGKEKMNGTEGGEPIAETDATEEDELKDVEMKFRQVTFAEEKGGEEKKGGEKEGGEKAAGGCCGGCCA